MGSIIDKLKTWWQTADRTQRIVTVFGSLFLVAVLGLTAMFAGKPNMQPVYTGLEQQDAAMVYDELSKAGLSPEISSRGDVVVASQDIPKARMALAKGNKLPRSSGSSFEFIDSISISDSQRKEQAKLKAAAERELEESISTMAGVASAKVHLNPGRQSAFGDEKEAPTASINISESNSGELSEESARSIARLVQNAVTGMDSSGISVITDQGRMVYDGADQESATSIASRKIEAEAREAGRRQRELQRELDEVFGVGNTRVMIDVQLNMDSITEQKDETLTGQTPIAEETATESMASGQGGNQPEAGFNANQPGGNPATSSVGNDSNYSSEVSSKQYPTSNVKTNTVRAQGDLVAMNVSVMANSAAVEDLGPLEDRIQQYIAPWAGDSKFTQSVTGVEFNTDAAKSAEAAAKQAASSERMQQILSLLPVVALVLVGVFLMRSLAKSLRQPTMQMALANGQKISLPAGADPTLAAIADQAQQAVALEAQAQAALPVAEAEVRSEDDYTMTEEEKRAVMRAMGIDEDDDSIDVAAIKRRIDVPLEQIKKMAKNNPEAVAMLLKSWMMEERI